MSKALDQENEKLLKKFLDKETPLKERVSRLVNSLGSINPTPSLNVVFENIEKEKYILVNAYRDISMEIREELYKILTEINSLKEEAVKIDIHLLREENRLNKFCSIYSKLPPLIEHKNDKDYKLFLESYEKGTELSQEISKLNFSALDLVDVQRVLDTAFATEMVEIEYLSSRLSDLIKTFRFVKTPQLIESYRFKFGSLNDLNKLIDDKNKEFEDFKRKLDDIKTVGKFPGGREEKLSTGITKDLFAEIKE